MKNVGEVVRLDRNTKKPFLPNIFLKDRSLQNKYGKVTHYTNFNFSFQGATIDEISFDVDKYVDGVLCPVWDKLQDLVIVSLNDKYNFEAHVTYTDNTKTVKSVNCQSLECELGQIMLNDFHVNDDEAMTYNSPVYDVDGTLTNPYNDEINFDENGNFIPTVFYNPSDTAHSLLHRVLADKAPHWSIGNVPTYVAIDEDTQTESCSTFQRTYTVDGTSIYDFLTGDVAKETNVVFLFDTQNRQINVYNLCDCYNINSNGTKTLILACEISQDTNILISKANVADEITLDGDKDSVKNCFKVVGGDEIINSYVAAVNLTGDNYIYQFSNLQYDDMSSELKNGLQSYQELIESSRDDYIGSTLLDMWKNNISYRLHITSELDAISALTYCESLNINTIENDIDKNTYVEYPYWYVIDEMDHGIKKYILCATNYDEVPSYYTVITISDIEQDSGIYTLLSLKYGEESYIESSMMPSVVISETDAQQVYMNIKNNLQQNYVGVFRLSNYSNDSFTGVHNNVESMANVYCDSRYSVKIIVDSDSYNKQTHTWYGQISVTKIGDETDYYPKTSVQIENKFYVGINDDSDELLFTKQKIEKALAKGDVSEFDSNIELWIEAKTIIIYGDYSTVEELEELFDFSQIGISTTGKTPQDIYDEVLVGITQQVNEIKSYFDLYSYNRLKSYQTCFAECMNILDTLGESSFTDGLSQAEIKELLQTRDVIRQAYYYKYDVISNSKTGLLAKRENQLNIVKQQISDLEKRQAEFQSELNLKNFLNDISDNLYNDFCAYRREDTYQNDNYISDGLTVLECIDKAKELLNVAEKEIKKSCKLQYTLTTSLHNLLLLPEFSHLYNDFQLFNYIRVKTDDDIFKLKLLSVDGNADSFDTINVTYAEEIESLEGSIEDVKSILEQAKSMSTSYSSTVLQAKQGKEAKNVVLNMYEEGINASKTAISGDSNNEVTIDNSGITLKQMNDEGFYGEKQLRLVGNNIVFTDDNWESIKAAFGEIKYYNPLTSSYETKYGLIADSIVGNLIIGNEMSISGKITLGNELYIGDEQNNVQITGSGITIKDGSLSTPTDVFRVDSNGNAYFKGEIVATSGTFYGKLESQGDVNTQYSRTIIEGGLIEIRNTYDNYNVLSGIIGNKIEPSGIASFRGGIQIKLASDNTYGSFFEVDPQTSSLNYPHYLSYDTYYAKFTVYGDMVVKRGNSTSTLTTDYLTLNKDLSIIGDIDGNLTFKSSSKIGSLVSSTYTNTTKFDNNGVVSYYYKTIGDVVIASCSGKMITTSWSANMSIFPSPKLKIIQDSCSASDYVAVRATLDTNGTLLLEDRMIGTSNIPYSVDFACTFIYVKA